MMMLLCRNFVLLEKVTKKEQEPVFKEWINPRNVTSASVSRGYGL
jgi:hypothetical protein